MSQNHPVAPASPPTSRPPTATAGAIIAVVLSSLGVLASILVLIAVATAGDGRDPQGRRDAGVMFGVLLPVTLVGLTAAVMTLRNSNGWRNTSIIFGFVIGAFWTLAAIGTFASNDRGSALGGSVLLILAAISIAPPVLLLINGAGRFYAGGTPALTSYAAPSGGIPALPPAGWYPVEGSSLRWWTGSEWSEHFHDGHSHDGQ